MDGQTDKYIAVCWLDGRIDKEIDFRYFDGGMAGYIENR
jgi:hypothetical protein